MRAASALRRAAGLVVSLGVVGAAWAADGQALPVATERAAIVARAESDLLRGDIVAAVEGFERAGSMQHAADSEMGLVRAFMQRGDYAQALAFAAHVAGEHLDAPDAAVQYAWLLRVGGQTAVSDRVIADSLARAPADATVSAAARAFASPLPAPTGILLDAPHRVAPAAPLAPRVSDVPADARVLSSGVLLPDGWHALVPASRAGRPLPMRLWVRNGLGETREAEVDTPAGGANDSGFIVLRLRSALRAGDIDLVVRRAAFAGSPASAVEYAEATPATPAWPWLRIGFLGSPVGERGWRRLNVDVAASLGGGPVFDASGRLAGIVARDAAGRAMTWPVALWPVAAAAPAVSNAVDGSEGRSASGVVPPERLYGRALRVALQVIGLP